MSDTVRIVAIFQAKPGMEAEFTAGAIACIAPTRQEPGCSEYRLNRDRDDASRLIFTETWANAAAFDAHMATPHLKTFLGVVERAAMEGFVIRRLEEIG